MSDESDTPQDPVWATIDAALGQMKPPKNWAWLASRLQVSDQVVSNWKRRKVPATRYRDIAHILGWTTDDLVSGGPDATTTAAAPDIVWTANGAGKSAMLATVKQFAEMARDAVPEPQLRLLSQAVSSLFEHGASVATVKAIDALTPELDTAIPSHIQTEQIDLEYLRRWRNAVFSMAEHEPLRERTVIAQFLTKVEQAMAEQAAARAAIAEGQEALAKIHTKAR